MKWGTTKDLRVIGAEEATKIWGGKIWYQDIFAWRKIIILWSDSRNWRGALAPLAQPPLGYKFCSSCACVLKSNL